MLKGKKAQLALITVIIIIIVIGFILFNNSNRLDAHALIGQHQIKLTKAYAEGEAAREYMQTAARLLVYDNLKVGACPSGVPENDFYEGMKEYSNIYASPNENFTTIFPVYLYEINVLDKGVQVIGWPREKIKIASAQYGFNYSVNAYFNEIITCEELEKYKEKPAFIE